MITKIDVLREKRSMLLQWDDQIQQEVALEELRRLCPCAVCEGRRMEEKEAGGLLMISSDMMNASAGVSEVTPVGRYAIQIRWEDGHDAGIYTYDYLRSFNAPASA